MAWGGRLTRCTKPELAGNRFVPNDALYQQRTQDATRPRSGPELIFGLPLRAPAALAVACALMAIAAAPPSVVAARQNSAARTPRNKTPRAAGPITIYVLGDVRQPGAVRLSSLRREPRLLDAIRAARGLRDGTALYSGATRSNNKQSASSAAMGIATSGIPTSTAQSARPVAWSATARLLRSSGARTFSLDALRAADANNIALRDGDVVVVTQRARAAVAASGAVYNAGPFPWRIGMTAADLLRLARIREHAVLRDAVLLRAAPTQAAPRRAESGQTTPGQPTPMLQGAGHATATQAAAPQDAVGQSATRAAQPITAQRIALDGAALLEGAQRGPTLLPGDVLFVPAGERATAVFGAVRRPGRRDYRPGLYLLDALADAGGASDRADVTAPLSVSAPQPPSPQLPQLEASFGSGPQADSSRASVGRDRPPHRTSLREIFRSGDVSGNSELPPGTQLIVPRRDGVTVLGAVARPQRLDLSAPAQRLADVLQAAGGATANALLPRIVILGGEGRARGIVVNGDNARSETQAVPDEQAAQATIPANVETPLRAGDVVFVGEKNSVAVQGAVERPGVVALQAGMTVMDAVKATGGLALTAAPERAVVLRPAGATLYALQADLQRILRDGDAAQNALLQEGDIVVIPFRETRAVGDEKRARMTLSPLLSLLAGASTTRDAPAPN